MTLDLDKYRELGAYDPDSSTADERRELLAFLVELGATDDDIGRASADGDLIDLVGEVAARPDHPFSARELSERSGFSMPLALKVYELLGIPVTDLDAERFSDDDVLMLETLAGGPAAMFDLDEIGEMLRVFGSSLARITDTAVSTFARGVEHRLSASGATEVVRAKAEAEATHLGRSIPLLLGVMMRHHMSASVRRLRDAARAAESPEAFRLAVGFVDIVGFTPMAAELDTRELGERVGTFENRSSDVVARAGGQVVKHMGDEIMFVVVDPATACEVALALGDEFTSLGVEPHAGLTYGEVVTRRGDYYGPTVNLGSRLVNHAVPGEILVNATLAEVVGDHPTFFFEPAGRRMVRGFDDPVDVLTLLRR